MASLPQRSRARPARHRLPACPTPVGGLGALLAGASSGVADLLDTVDAPTMVIDRAGNVVIFNRACVELSGYRASDVVGKPFREVLVPTEDEAAGRAGLMPLDPGRFPRRYEGAWRTGSGRLRSVSWSESALLDDEGAVSFVVATGEDVTERHRADASMRAVEDVGRLLARTGPRAEVLDRVLGILEARFGFRYTSIHLRQGEVVRLGASRGYDEPIDEFDGTRGVIGRVMRTRRVVFVPDTASDTDYVAAAEGIGSEISVPLLVEGELLGVLNVEGGSGPGALDDHDLRLVTAIGDRLATAMAFGRDRQELAARADALAASEEQLRLIIETASDAFIAIDRGGLVTGWNLQAESMFGWSREEAIDRELADLIVPAESREAHVSALRRAGPSMAGEALRRRMELDARHRSGRTFPVEMTLWSVGSGDEIRFNALVQDISSRREFEERLRFQAYHDPLTRLPNRALLLDRLEASLSHASASGRVAVVLLDLDGFKVINDTLGHRIGDQILIEVGRRLGEAVRPGDIAARLGGDEFTVLLGDISDAAVALAVAVRIGAAIAAPMVVDGRRLTVTASMGIALAESPSVSSEDLLAKADVALYEAKETGRARHQLFDPPMRERAWDRFELERDLRLAIERDELVVHYQPVLDLASGRLEEVEALVRWQHPTRGLLLPDTFVPLAERMGLIGAIDTIVLERACRQLREWHTGFPARARFGVSINLAAAEFHESGLAQRVGAVLSAHGLRPSDLALELTETAMLHDAEATTETLAALHALGVSVLVDDFGTGFSALHYFKRLRLDGLKIDRSFVSGVGRSGKDVAIITAAIGFARALGLRVIAEGIETTAQLRSLQRLGCERGQGFLLQRPLPADRLTALLASSPDWPASLVRVVDEAPGGRPIERAASLQPSQVNVPN